MSTPIAELKKLHIAFLEAGCDFSKVPSELKVPMLVKVFRTEPYFYVNDKTHYVSGYFTDKAMKSFQNSSKKSMADLKGDTLKITKFSLQLNDLGNDEFTHTSFMGKEIRLIIEDFTLSRYLKSGKDVNKFVVNMCRDDEVKLHMAIHQYKTTDANKTKTLEKFLKTTAGIAFGSLSDMFCSVYGGPIKIEEVQGTSKNEIPDRLKMPELVTCIVDDDYKPKKDKKRSIKTTVKDEIIEAESSQNGESKSESQSSYKPSSASSRSSRSKRSKKIKEETKLEITTSQKSPSTESINSKSKFESEVMEILGYFKKSKSNLDMDF